MSRQHDLRRFGFTMSRRLMPQKKKKKKKKKKRSFKRSQPIVISPHREPILALLATFNALLVNTL